MNPLTLEWISKAEADLDTAKREINARQRPNFDASCFHTQQMVEKYLKAYLQENNRDIPRIHNLVELLTLCSVIDQSLLFLEADVKVLDRYAVRVRYPGESATKSEAKDALRTSLALRAILRQRLGIE